MTTTASPSAWANPALICRLRPVARQKDCFLPAVFLARLTAISASVAAAIIDDDPQAEIPSSEHPHQR